MFSSNLSSRSWFEASNLSSCAFFSVLLLVVMSNERTELFVNIAPIREVNFDVFIGIDVARAKEK